VRGYDRRHRLQRGRRTRTFRNSKDSVIVQHIASEYGLSAVCENSELEHEYVLQDNLSDFDFLVGRAEAIGFELLVEDRKLIFRRRRHAAAPTLSLALGEELLRFEPRLSTVGQATEVIVRGWDCDDQKAINGSSGPVKQVMGGRHSGDAQAMAAFGKAVHVETTRPVASQLAAEHAARSLMTRMALDYVTGEGSCAGRPELRAGAVVALTGLGRRFSGNYYLVRVTHRFMSEWHDRNWRPNASHVGWETHFQVRRNAT
jgi:phage protein D